MLVVALDCGSCGCPFDESFCDGLVLDFMQANIVSVISNVRASVQRILIRTVVIKTDNIFCLLFMKLLQEIWMSQCHVGNYSNSMHSPLSGPLFVTFWVRETLF